MSIILMILVFSLIKKFNHFLFILFNMEALLLVLLVTMFMVMNFMSSFFFILVFMVISICESIMGLSMLMFMIRMKGSDYLMMN